MSEFNTKIKENNVSPEFKPVDENVFTKESLNQQEFTSQEESSEQPKLSSTPEERAKKTNHALSMLSGGLVTIIASVAVGVTTMLNVNMSAEFKKVEFADGKINYEVAVSEMTEKEALTAYLYDSENHVINTIVLVDEDNDGIITGEIDLNKEELETKLSETKDGVLSYRLTLKGTVGLDVERSFDSYVCEIANAEAKFEDVTGECHCSIDGYYYFQMNFTDPFGLFTEFKATITDSLGNVVECNFTDNLHEQQRIYVSNLRGNKGILKITYLADGKEQTISIDITI